jgi:excinuclease ABC subunit B
MEGARSAEERGRRLDGTSIADLTPEQVLKRIKKLEGEMMKLARNLEFEAAAKVRDELSELRSAGLGLSGRRAG